MFDGKALLINGGMGALGNAVLPRFLDTSGMIELLQKLSCVRQAVLELRR